MPNKSNGDLPNIIPLVWSILFTILIASGAYMNTCLVGISFHWASFFVVLAGLTLGPWWGAFSIILYLVFGALNLPFFSGGSSGISSFLGPSGGFLLGYLPNVFGVGLLRDPQGQSVIRNSWAGFLGLLALYSVGLAILIWIKDFALVKAFWFALPYLGADLIKVMSAVILVKVFLSTPSFKKSFTR